MMAYITTIHKEKPVKLLVDTFEYSEWDDLFLKIFDKVFVSSN